MKCPTCGSHGIAAYVNECLQWLGLFALIAFAIKHC